MAPQRSARAGASQQRGGERCRASRRSGSETAVTYGWGHGKRALAILENGTWFAQMVIDKGSRRRGGKVQPFAGTERRPAVKSLRNRVMQQVSSPAQALRVLVVEDEPSTRAALCQFLRTSGYACAAAADGAQALELTARFH